MNQSIDTQPQLLKLHCCNGAPPPQPIVDGWQRFLSMPPSANNEIWSLLGPALTDPMNPANNKLVTGFCQEHSLTQQDVLDSVQSCAFLVGRAGALDLSKIKLQEDLTALSQGPHDGFDVLLSRYEGVKTELRKTIVIESLADHGKLFMGLDWRVDTFGASHRGAQLNTSVVLLTLRYRDGNHAARVTLQLPQEGLMELKAFCDRFSG